MKFLNQLIAAFIGGLFVFSGLIKCNDPVGTQIKLEEYFDVFAMDFAPFFEVFIPYALPLALVVLIAEVVLGVALLANFKQRWVLNAVLGLIVFFTFLTFYTAYFNKVTDCGCFGDAIPLTPWQSFTKDVILLVLTLFLWVQGRRIPNTGRWIGGSLTVLGLAFSIYVCAMALAHLPFMDFRPYAKGLSIAEQMQAQEPCQTEYVVIRGKETIRTTEWQTDFMKKVPIIKETQDSMRVWDEAAQDSLMQAYTRRDTVMKSVPNYDSLYTRILNEKRCTPKINDYGLYNTEGDDYTDASLQGDQFFIVIHNAEHAQTDALPQITALQKELSGFAGLSVVVLTSEVPETFEALRHEYQLDAPFYLGDQKMLKTMIRSNPGLLLLRNGVVKEKWHYNDTPDAEKVKNLLTQ
ncbi:MAG: DoxX family protein [Bernardetiaceae bacterium]